MFKLLNNLKKSHKIINFYDFHFCFIILLLLLVIFLQNPIYALLCFIFLVLNILIIFILFDLEFIALIVFLIYVGAIAVLFLALIMFLNLSYLFYYETQNFSNNILILFSGILLFILFFFNFQTQIFLFSYLIPQQALLLLSTFTLYDLAFIFYSQYSFLIMLCGFLLYLTTILTLIYTTTPKLYTLYFNKQLLKQLKTNL
jgi:NADH-quinone oxidoreductase subunit J